jgi:hypothetical protein
MEVERAAGFRSAGLHPNMSDALACALAHVGAQSVAHCGVGQESLQESHLDSVTWIGRSGPYRRSQPLKTEKRSFGGAFRVLDIGSDFSPFLNRKVVQERHP